MKWIPLTKGQTALIDDADYEAVSRHKWYAKRGRNTFYAASGHGSNRLLMHTLILGKGVTIDHRDGDGLDNRRHNLRSANHSQNQWNRRKRKTAVFKGVTFNPKNGKHKPWSVYIKRKFLGTFATPEEGARVYDMAARKTYGEFAWLNFPLEEENARTR